MKNAVIANAMNAVALPAKTKGGVVRKKVGRKKGRDRGVAEAAVAGLPRWIRRNNVK